MWISPHPTPSNEPHRWPAHPLTRTAAAGEASRFGADLAAARSKEDRQLHTEVPSAVLATPRRNTVRSSMHYADGTPHEHQWAQAKCGVDGAGGRR